MAEPVRHTQPARRCRHGLGVVHRLPAVADHPARRVLPEGDGRRGHVEGVRRDRHRGDSHRPGQAGRRHLRLAADPECGRPLRPDQHADRPGVRHRRRVPADVRHRQLVRRHHHRRHRARPHRQRRRLPAGRDEVRRLPGHLPHGRDRPARLGSPARRAGRRGLGQHRRRDRGMAGQGRLHHRAPATGHLLRRGRQGDQLECHPPRRRHRRRRAPLGLPALLQGRPAVDQLAGPVVRRHAAGHRRRAALADRPRHRADCAWTPTVSSAPRRPPPKTAPHGRRAIRCPRRPTT